jgi:hypothetical protein
MDVAQIRNTDNDIGDHGGYREFEFCIIVQRYDDEYVVHFNKRSNYTAPTHEIEIVGEL